MTIVDRRMPIDTNAQLMKPLPSSAENNATSQQEKGQSSGKKKPIKQEVGVIITDPATGNVLMISSRKRVDAWVIPRGVCNTEPVAEHPELAAIRVLYEKAGISATRLTRRIGTYTQANKKGNIVAHHWMYEVHNPILLDSWPQSEGRRRAWIRYDQALELSFNKSRVREAIKNSSIAPSV